MLPTLWRKHIILFSFHETRVKIQKLFHNLVIPAGYCDSPGVQSTCIKLSLAVLCTQRTGRLFAVCVNWEWTARMHLHAWVMRAACRTGTEKITQARFFICEVSIYFKESFGFSILHAQAVSPKPALHLENVVRKIKSLNYWDGIIRRWSLLSCSGFELYDYKYRSEKSD